MPEIRTKSGIKKYPYTKKGKAAAKKAKKKMMKSSSKMSYLKNK